MPNIKFYGSEESETYDHNLEVLANAKNEIYICVDGGKGCTGYIVLDVSTAIQYSKQLRKEIAIAKQNIDSNGRA